jgi:hypothetical protein
LKGFFLKLLSNFIFVKSFPIFFLNI